MTDDGRTGPGTDQRDWLPCISEIARGGGHDSCSVDRTAVAPCSGTIKTVTTGRALAAPGNIPTAAAPPAASAPTPDMTQPSAVQSPPRPPTPAPSATTAQAPPPQAPTQPPADATAATSDNPEDEGNAVTKAAKKTWDCMSSFFKKC